MSDKQYKGVSFETIRDWYRINHQGRLLEERAVGYIKKAKGWSYHAPFAGHDGVQLILGQAFRPNKDFLFPYYRDLLTSLSAGLTAEEIILNGLSKEGDVAGGGRHMSNHFAKPSVRVQNVSSCTGNHTLHGVGVARAIKHYGGDEIAFTSQGEASTSEGLWRVEGDLLTYEVVQVQPPLPGGQTPPTPAGGFGSTNNGALGDDNVQRYRRQP